MLVVAERRPGTRPAPVRLRAPRRRRDRLLWPAVQRRNWSVQVDRQQQVNQEADIKTKRLEIWNLTL